MKINKIIAAAICCSAFTAPAFTADMIEIKYTTVSVPTDFHTKAMQVFKKSLTKAVPNRFNIQLYDSGSLFKSGPDLDALQRDNAEMAYLSFQLIADEIPKYSVLTAGYLFKSPEHYRTFLASDIGKIFIQDVADIMDVQILDACYLGTRELNLRKVRDVQTPADLAGVKLRMPGSDSWLFLGDALWNL